MKNLPIGISTLSKIFENDMIYVDKTQFVYELAETAGAYFLSRPRRFGKSLFVDTLKEIFEGNQELFTGLYIADKWDWSRKYPVIKIDFAIGGIKNTNILDIHVKDILSDNARRYQIADLTMESPIELLFKQLIQKLHDKYQSKVVILIDEYDKPMLDNIEDLERMKELRDGLKSLYSVIKDQDALIQFVFITGVSKFAKVSIFSGINNLSDLTLDERYATICGYTQNDLEQSFADHLAGVDWEQLKQWYNGYNFLGEPVYNPFDILLFIDKGKVFRNYWFETGSPAFLVQWMQRNKYFLPDLSVFEIGEELLSSFEIDRMKIVTILFQTGYLTIDTPIHKMGRIFYKLKIPNQEVRIALNEQLFNVYTDLDEQKLKHQSDVYDALEQADLPALEKAIRRLFAGIPYRNFTNNDLPEYEGYYASVLYAFFSSVNCTVIPEDINNHGQADLTIILGKNVYVMEIKVIPVDHGFKPMANGENAALAQIIAMDYAQKYVGKYDRVFELGMIFAQDKRNLVAFDGRERIS